MLAWLASCQETLSLGKDTLGVFKRKNIFLFYILCLEISRIIFLDQRSKPIIVTIWNNQIKQGFFTFNIHKLLSEYKYVTEFPY